MSSIYIDPSIALGSVVHLIGLIAFLVFVCRAFTKRLDRIEKKQDHILSKFKP